MRPGQFTIFVAATCVKKSDKVWDKGTSKERISYSMKVEFSGGSREVYFEDKKESDAAPDEGESFDMLARCEQGQSQKGPVTYLRDMEYFPAMTFQKLVTEQNLAAVNQPRPPVAGQRAA